MKTRSTIAFILPMLILASFLYAAERPLVDAGAPFGELPLIDEVDCTQTDHQFKDYPEGISQIQTLLGQPCRVLDNTQGEFKYFAYKLGADAGLEGNKAYVLTVEFPEDAPRSMVISNRGCDTPRGVYTGSALGDTLYTYSNNNIESLQVPLSGEYYTWKQLFFMHDRLSGFDNLRDEGVRSERPAEGIWVIISQPAAIKDPLSQGAAVSRIRLFEVPDPSKFDAPMMLPPADLPQRHIFWREEMSNTLIEQKNPENKAYINEIDLFENQVKLMKFLGINTFCRDLLEFGHNQGWDCGADNTWYNRNRNPERWEKTLKMLKKYNLSVLPFYEYAGSVGTEGVGVKKHARPLGRDDSYTHIWWAERFYADVTHPDTLPDAQKVLEATIVRYKDEANFIGAWFRTRNSHIPMSFSDDTLARFTRECSIDEPVTREKLLADQTLLNQYYRWWFDQRKAFLVALRDYLRENVNPDAFILFTAEYSEPGPPLLGGNYVVTDDMETWMEVLSRPEHKTRTPLAYDSVIETQKYKHALLNPPMTWADNKGVMWEWQHSAPQADPLNYKDTPGVMMAYPFNRAYTVADADTLETFRNPQGLAIIRHYSLNENSNFIPKEGQSRGEEPTGYYIYDADRAGPYCMMAEALAVANGDPRYIGYLTGTMYNRGDPEYVRNFNTAFLALPALPSEIIPDATSDTKVVVRKIPTEKHGTYLAIVNTDLQGKENIAITLPAEGKVTDAATGEAIDVQDGKITLNLYPCQLKSLLIK